MSAMMALNRRTFLMAGMGAGAALSMGLARPQGVAAAGKEYELPALPYGFDALEPHIDKMTMEIHHDRHHKAYVDNLNKALKDSDLLGTPLEELLANKAAKVPEAIRQGVINNGGGHANHSMFWMTLGAPGGAAGPKGALGEAIKSTFTDVKTLSEKMNDAGLKRFGSGWSWLVKTADGKLDVLSTANQDSPIMDGKTPLFGIDVWEHAYYLKYQNKRADYLKAIWNVVNWGEVEKRFAK